MFDAIGRIKRFLVGQPLATVEEHEQRLTKRLALAIFASAVVTSVRLHLHE